MPYRLPNGIEVPVKFKDKTDSTVNLVEVGSAIAKAYTVAGGREKDIFSKANSIVVYATASGRLIAADVHSPEMKFTVCVKPYGVYKHGEIIS